MARVSPRKGFEILMICLRRWQDGKDSEDCYRLDLQDLHSGSAVTNIRVTSYPSNRGRDQREVDHGKRQLLHTCLRHLPFDILKNYWPSSDLLASA